MDCEWEHASDANFAIDIDTDDRELLLYRQLEFSDVLYDFSERNLVEMTMIR